MGGRVGGRGNELGGVEGDVSRGKGGGVGRVGAFGEARAINVPRQDQAQGRRVMFERLVSNTILIARSSYDAQFILLQYVSWVIPPRQAVAGA